MRLAAIALGFLGAGCLQDLEGVDPLPADNHYRDWVHHPDHPFTRDVAGHLTGERYLYYNDLGLFAGVEQGGFPAEGAIVVKEVYGERETPSDVPDLVYLGVMRMLPSHPEAGEDGWVYSLSFDNGETEQLGYTCETCHYDPLSYGSLWILPPSP